MVKVGYQQTEVGEIPEDWDAKSLSALCSMKSGETITSASINDSADFPCYGGNGLRGNTNRFTHNGAFALVGRQGALCGNVQKVKGKFFASEHAIVATALAGTNIDWLYYILGEMNLNQYSESSAQPGLTVSKLLPLEIPAPKMEDEQKAIADALSDVDALIGSLEKLIAKKRDMKTATMQQLLTGKKRLPGFGGEWPELQLAEFTTMRGGAGFPLGLQGDVSSKTPFFKVSDFNHPENATFMRRSNNYLSEERISQYGYKPIPENSIVIAKIGAAVFLERKRILDRKSLIDNNMMALTFETTVANYRFLHQLLLTVKLSDLVSTTALPSLSASDVGALQIKLPSLEEQAAIADVLVSMDEEID